MFPMEVKPSMYEICVAIYQRFGQFGVIKFADAIEWQTWAWCEPCEYESPITDEPDAEPVCLVCGSVV
jgi:hypothetical protein